MFGFLKGKLYKYHIDLVTLSHIEGWAMHKKHDKPCHVAIKTLGLEVVAEGMTSVLRQDMKNRRCGFSLPVKGDLMSLVPGRFLVFVDGVKVANCHVVVPLSISTIPQALEARSQALVSLRTERLEREVEMLSRRLAEIECKSV